MKKIVVEGLKYRYPGAERLALDDVSFEVNAGELTGIIGKNGSGKSTLCYALTGLVPHFFRGAYGGRVLLDGLEVKTSTVAEISRKAGLVFDNPFTQISAAKETVFEEIAFGLENAGVPREEMAERIGWSMKLLGIEGIREKNPFELSGGQMQRVAIAGMLVMKPDILILDEPTSQLDPQGTEEVFQVIRNLAKEGMTILVAEHKVEKLAEYADKLLLLHDGKCAAFDAPKRVFSMENAESYGVELPLAAQIAKELDLRDEAGLYPAAPDELLALLKGRLQGAAGTDERFTE
ncbi:MAG: cobalt ABC transporter ATP-binding protein [Caldibacillus debilis]|mgnify:FL=1|uniref:Cobalt ABC transporter ATP-binding protein n=1 Tax=Caldibacillus debilis TaxID=301148 RepID=A0A3E0JW25_9BACI|nr:ABC transporter ATP-binding protein [Caldibacillus debilis]REJ24367.1 MAG: cobalt ABC transporter ATP-binding protein [Caldibacillus debilis]